MKSKTGWLFAIIIIVTVGLWYSMICNIIEISSEYIDTDMAVQRCLFCHDDRDGFMELLETRILFNDQEIQRLQEVAR